MTKIHAGRRRLIKLFDIGDDKRNGCAADLLSDLTLPDPDPHAPVADVLLFVVSEFLRDGTRAGIAIREDPGGYPRGFRAAWRVVWRQVMAPGVQRFHAAGADFPGYQKQSGHGGLSLIHI